MKHIYKLTAILMMICLSSPLLAQLPEEIQWKHLVKTYTPDSSEMVLTLNGKPLQGKYKIPLDENSFALYNIKNGMITGDAFWYTNGGHLECKLIYKKGIRNGLKENYDNDGKVWLRQEYKDGKQHGISEMYNGGKIVTKSEYKAGKKHGLSLTYMGDNVSTESYYENDLKNGLSKNYGPDGKLSVEINYKNDKRNGPYRTYNNGEIMTETNYLDDLQNGLSTSFVMGKKNMDATFENGKRHGVSHMYKPDGAVLFESYYLLGEKVTKADFEKYQSRLKK